MCVYVCICIYVYMDARLSTLSKSISNWILIEISGNPFQSKPYTYRKRELDLVTLMYIHVMNSVILFIFGFTGISKSPYHLHL